MGKDIFLFGLTTRVRSFVCLSCIKYPELRTTYSILCQTWDSRKAAEARSRPHPETHAEAHLLRLAGAHAVGMSTVPEVLAAVHAGMKTLGFSIITNSLVRREAPLTHEEVLATAKQTEQKLSALIRSTSISSR